VVASRFILMDEAWWVFTNCVWLKSKLFICVSYQHVRGQHVNFSTEFRWVWDVCPISQTFNPLVQESMSGSSAPRQ
jgi:hypothetical protein